MGKVTSTFELKIAIQQLEGKQAIEVQLLKDEFHNVLNTTLKSIPTSPYLIENIINTGVGLVTGYISKKLIVGKSSNSIRNILGSILQFGVTNAVTQHSGAFRSVSHLLSNFFINHKREEKKYESQDGQ